MRRIGESKSEKTARKLAEIVNDLDLDLEQVGIYLGRLRPSVFYHRLNVILESAHFERNEDEHIIRD